MTNRWPVKLFGVTIIHIRDGVARKVVSVVPGGRGVWCLLPDGTVGCSDADLFRWAQSEKGTRGVYIAERLWRLGKLTKGQYQKIAAAHTKEEKRKNQKSTAHDLAHYAVLAGIALTASQKAQLAKLGYREAA